MSFKLDDIQYNAALKLNAEYRYHNFLQGAKKGLEVFVLKKDEDDILFRLFEDDEEKKNTPAGLFWSEKAGRTNRNIETVNASVTEAAVDANEYERVSTSIAGTKPPNSIACILAISTYPRTILNCICSRFNYTIFFIGNKPPNLFSTKQKYTIFSRRAGVIDEITYSD